MGMRHFQKVVLRVKFVLSLQSFICHIPNVRVWKYVFTRAAIVLFVSHSPLESHSYLTCVPRVTIVPYLCRSCRTLVARVWHSCCKIDQIKKVDHIAILCWQSHNTKLLQHTVIVNFIFLSCFRLYLAIFYLDVSYFGVSIKVNLSRLSSAILIII